MTPKPETPKIEICEQDLIDQAAVLGREFFSRVLDLDWDECLVTDESNLSDFCFSGMPEELLPKGLSWTEANAVWDRWVLQKVKDEFGVELPRTGMRLLAVFESIEAHRRQHLH